MMAETLVVIGSGVMGRGIAYAGALGGFKVRLVDVRPDILHQAENIIGSVMEKGLARGKINGADAERIKANIEYTVDLPAVAGSADVIIEAVPEKMEIKKEVFEKMDRFAPAGCILATNTSTMSLGSSPAVALAKKTGMSQEWLHCSPGFRSKPPAQPLTAYADQASMLSILQRKRLWLVYIAGGTESMTRAPFVMAKPENGYPRGNLEMFDTTIRWRFVNEKLKKMYGTDSMPETAENVAKQFHISREAQDAFAFTSQMRAKVAIEANRFQDEIVPVVYTDQKGESVSVIRDEHPRPDTTPEKLARLKPLFAGGQIAGLIEDCPSVAQLLEEMVKEARAVLTRSMARL